jgi:hypothetical protein
MHQVGDAVAQQSRADMVREGFGDAIENQSGHQMCS